MADSKQAAPAETTASADQNYGKAVPVVRSFLESVLGLLGVEVEVGAVLCEPPDDDELQHIRRDIKLCRELAQQIPDVLTEIYLLFHAPAV